MASNSAAAVDFEFNDDVKSGASTVSECVASGSCVSEGSGGAGSSSRGGPSGSSRGGGSGPGACACCPLPKKGKSKYCDKHRRAYECIKREATKDSCEAAPTPDHEAFLEIFGSARRAGNDMLAGKVLVDFCEQHGSGISKGGKHAGGAAAGRKRGFVELAGYIHGQGARREIGNVSKRRRLDWEAFSSAMRNVRSWTVERSKQEWDKLKACDTPRDYLGPPYDPLRLQIPSWMTGDDAEEVREVAYEDKQMVQQSRLGRLSDEMKDSIRSESRRGFNLVSRAQLEDMSAPLPSTAMTNTGSLTRNDALTILRDAAPGECAGSPANIGGDAAATAADGPTPSPTKPQQQQVLDIARTRNMASVAARKEVTKAADKLLARVTAARGELAKGDRLQEHVYYESCAERLSASLCWLGLQLPKLPDGGVDYAAEPTQLNFQGEIKD